VKFGILYRVGLALALTGVLASGLTGYYGYMESRKLLTAAAEQRLRIAAGVLNRQLTKSLEDTARDIQVLAGHPQAARVLGGVDDPFQALVARNSALLFEGLLRHHPEYLQLRLIGAADHGRECLRVDRVGGLPVRIDAADLQEKGHYPYVFETLALPAGAVYLSKASINHETGSNASLGQPTLHMAAPVYDTDGKRGEALGVVVVNVDLRGLFRQITRDLPADVGLYLANGAGEFLIHPDPAKAFAFDRGREALVQDEFPATAALTGADDGASHELVTTGRDAVAGSVIAAFARQPASGFSGADVFILGLSLPLRTALADSEQLGRTTLRIVLGFSLLASLLAFLLARALTRPLNDMVAAVRAFSPGEHPARLPHARRDEIGTLARTIADMQHQIGVHVQELTQKQQALDRLASHDSLTGLANRRQFLERLEQALARARRHTGGFALLFIDLNDFKDVNDRYGHAAGDAVLCAVARRLIERVRETDTVARLGGDEFVILLDAAHDDAALARLAHDLRRALRQPVDHHGRHLHIDASVGISRHPHDGDDADTLIAAADTAMYRAKSGAGEHVCFAGQAAGA
jgi:diguanylate cyclase (GGDEF)-like protein